MKWIDSSYEVLMQKDGLEGMYEHIEECGRICYKSVGTRYFFILHSDDDYQKVLDMMNLEFDTESSCEPGDFRVDIDSHGIYLSVSQKWLNTKQDLKEIVEKYEITSKRAFSVYTGSYSNLTARRFVENVLEKNGHGAMLEHGTVPLDLPWYRIDVLFNYLFNKYSRIKLHHFRWLITTNYRVVVEKDRKKDLRFFKWTTHHYNRPCVRFVMDRVGSQSVERHRGKYGISFAQESTRFCNYSKDKFGGELIFIIPRWMYKLRDRLATYIDSLDKTSNEWMLELSGEDMIKMLVCKDRSVAAYWDHCAGAENTYNFLNTTEESEKLYPEDARGVLPLQVKTEFVMTAYDEDWKHFFELRDDSHAHPDIQYIAHELRKEDVFNI